MPLQLSDPAFKVSGYYCRRNCWFKVGQGRISSLPKEVVHLLVHCILENSNVFKVRSLHREICEKAASIFGFLFHTDVSSSSKGNLLRDFEKKTDPFPSPSIPF